MKVFCDIETNNLLPILDTIHSLVVKTEQGGILSCTDTGTDEVYFSIYLGMRKLLEADEIIGHNFIGFDAPALVKLGYPDVASKVIDTLNLSRLIIPDMLGHDMKNYRSIPKNQWGSHSLKAWGYRLGCYKGEFGETTDWSSWSKEMQDYCVQDVEVTEKLYHHLMSFNPDPRAIKIEMDFQIIMAEQERVGVPFDSVKAYGMKDKVQPRIEELTSQIREVVPEHKKYTKFTPKRDNASKGYITGQTIMKVKSSPFNPNSRQQILAYLDTRYGWKPTAVTKKGNPQLSGEDIEALGAKHPEVEKIARFLEANKLASQLYGGDKAWLNYVINGRIHGRIITNGAITGRCTHCVPTSTQALTMEGWKEHKDIVVGEYILGFDIEDRKKKWTKVTAINTFSNAVVGSIGNNSVRLRCTEDHRWVVAKRGRKDIKYKLLKASEMKSHDAVVTNGAYLNTNTEYKYEYPNVKYGYPHIKDIMKFNSSQLNCFLIGFMLADGHLKPSTNGRGASWGFSQAEGDILDAAHTAMFLNSENRVSKTCKNRLSKGNAQRYGYIITDTQCHWLRSKEGMTWRAETVEDVWCPTTELNTWVMRQADGVITVTGNSNPNLAQIPSVRKFMGKECRELFYAPEGYKIVGADASGLELRMLAHYLYPYDHGAYAKVILEGDVHIHNQEAAGLGSRDEAKTFIYSFIYGCGALKTGAQVHPLDTEFVQKIKGRQIQESFSREIVGYRSLKQDVGYKYKTEGTLRGIDGRIFKPRGEHSALNTLLQGAGAVVCKYWTNKMWELIHSRGLYEHVKPAINCHDESQLVVRESHSDTVGKLMVEAIQATGIELGLNIALDGEYKIGNNWAETH